MLELRYSNVLLQLYVGSLGFECEYTGFALDTFQHVVGGVLVLPFLISRVNVERKHNLLLWLVSSYCQSLERQRKQCL